jgi:MinD superfamily P-loop ATPase
MPCGLVINRSDIGTHDVRNYAENEKLPILMEIPFDRGIAEVYSRGDLIIDQLPEWKPRFRDLYNGILRLIDRGSDT